MANALENSVAEFRTKLMKGEIDHRYLTTPAGMAMGLLAVRTGLPEKYRTGSNYAMGAGVGGAGGLVAGSYSNPYGKSIAQYLRYMFLGKDTPSQKVRGQTQAINAGLDASPAGKPSSEQIAMYQKLLGESNLDTGLDPYGKGSVETLSPGTEHGIGKSRSAEASNYERNVRILHNTLGLKRALSTGDADKAQQAQRELDRAKQGPETNRDSSNFIGKTQQWIENTL